MELAHGRGRKTMGKICEGLDQRFIRMAKEQDSIGWWCFMEGMICKSMRRIQTKYHYREGTTTNLAQWAQGLNLKLLKAMHGQWIYQNVQIHNAVTGMQATVRKEVIQKEIEEQMELGGDGLVEEDQWMLEVNLGDTEKSTGKREEYWLLAIKAARVALTLAGQQRQTRAEPAL